MGAKVLNILNAFFGRSWNQTVLKDVRDLSSFQMANNGLEILLTAPMIRKLVTSVILPTIETGLNCFGTRSSDTKKIKRRQQNPRN